jgi:hypothetical protein
MRTTHTRVSKAAFLAAIKAVFDKHDIDLESDKELDAMVEGVWMQFEF